MLWLSQADGSAQGLRLAIVHQVVKAHDRTISVSSSEALVLVRRFTDTLPVVRVPEAVYR